MRLEAERRFDVPVREGFDYITDQRNWPEYWPGFVRLEPGSRWSEPGDVTRIVVRLLGRTVPLEMTLRRCEPLHYVEYTTTQPGMPDARHERLFEDTGGGLRFRIAIEFEPRGFFDRFIVRRGVLRAMRRTIANLDAVFSRYPDGERKTRGAGENARLR
jgi:uncharacterized protein YndB with AHSA1/START domain